MSEQQNKWKKKKTPLHSLFASMWSRPDTYGELRDLSCSSSGLRGSQGSRERRTRRYSQRSSKNIEASFSKISYLSARQRRAFP